MGHYRKKPIVIEAHQWYPHTGKGPLINGVCYCARGGAIVPGVPHIHTLEGDMEVSSGDWIIKGVNGEFYPCKPDIFEKTYEPVEELAEV